MRQWLTSGLTAAAVVVAAACGGGEPEPGDEPGTTDTTATAEGGAAAGESSPAVVTVTAAEYAFAPPARVESGLTEVRLANRGEEAHHMTLFRLGEGKTVEDFREAMLTAPPLSAAPEWAVPAGGPGAVAPGEQSNAFLDLEPGSYAMMCFVPAPDGAPHFTKGMLQGLEVSPAGAARGAVEPAADLSVELVDYDFKWSAPPTPGAHKVRVTNGGPQHHEIQVFRLAEGKSLPDFMEYLKGMMEGAGEGEPPGSWAGGLSTIPAGGHGMIDLPLEAGRYVLICFEPDTKDGRVHFMHGMVKEITVGEAAAAD